MAVTFAKDFLRLRYRSSSSTVRFVLKEPCFAGVLRGSVGYEIRMGPISPGCRFWPLQKASAVRDLISRSQRR